MSASTLNSFAASETFFARDMRRLLKQSNYLENLLKLATLGHSSHRFGAPQFTLFLRQSLSYGPTFPVGRTRQHLILHCEPEICERFRGGASLIEMEAAKFHFAAAHFYTHA